MEEYSCGPKQAVVITKVGVCDGPVYCGVCGDETGVSRDCDGPTSFAEAMAGTGKRHDLFWCPNMDEDWHRQAISLREEATKTCSAKLASLFMDEADAVIASRSATKVQGVWGVIGKGRELQENSEDEPGAA